VLKVLSVKGKKQAGKLTSGERGRNVTVLSCINAARNQLIPSLFVFPRKRINKKLEKYPPEGSLFDMLENGWITSTGFLKWMKEFVNCICPTEDNPQLPTLNGHSSHKYLEVILFAHENHVHMLSLPPHMTHMLSLPPHMTHMLQPLHCAVMKPFKHAYNKACGTWMWKYHCLKTSFDCTAGQVDKAFVKICKMETAKKPFKCTFQTLCMSKFMSTPSTV
jgi:hypothetical protein